MISTDSLKNPNVFTKQNNVENIYQKIQKQQKDLVDSSKITPLYLMHFTNIKVRPFSGKKNTQHSIQNDLSP